MYTQHPAPVKQANIQVTPTHNNVGGGKRKFWSTHPLTGGVIDPYAPQLPLMGDTTTSI